MDILPKKLEVDTSGTTENFDFSIEASYIPAGSEDLVEITATMNFASASPETVLFKKTGGSWVFTPTVPGWLTLLPPTVVSGSDPLLTESVTFPATVFVSNQNTKITFNTIVKDSTSAVILERDFESVVTVIFPVADSGVPPKPKVVFHTFTDWDQLPAQDPLKKYGSIDDTHYRVKSTFTGKVNASAPLKAFAVCDGHAFIQEIVAKPNLVNLILKPKDQPVADYIPVKFFVYRGLKKSLFLDGSGAVLADNQSANTDLLNRMWQVRNASNLEQQELAALNSTTFTDLLLVRPDLGLNELADSPLAGTTSIDEIFDTYTFQPVQEGWYIGEFDSTEDYGFEIMLDSATYKHTLADVRELDHVIELTYDPGQTKFIDGDEEDISTKLKREQVLAYVDPAAYIPMMYYNKVVQHQTTGPTEYSGNDLYANVIDKFATKDKVYVDLRNELGNSLNFYGSYGDGTTLNAAQVQFTDAASSVVTKPYHDGNGWPLLVLNATDFPNNTIDEKLKLILALPEGDNAMPTAVLSGSAFYTDFPQYTGKFQVLNITSGFTDEIEFGVPNHPDSAGVVFPFTVKATLARRYDAANLDAIPSTLTRPWKDDYLDNLMVFNLPLPSINNAGTVQWNSFNDLLYIGWSSLQGIDFNVKTGVARDSIGEIVYAFTDGPAEADGSTSASEIHSPPGIYQGRFEGVSFYLMVRDYLKLANVNILELNGPGIKIPHIDSHNSSSSIDVLNVSFDDVLSIAYTSAEKATIGSTAAPFLAGVPVYMIALNHTMKSDLDDLPYFEMELGLQGVVFNTGTLAYDVQRITTGITVYSFDGRNYMSSDYTTALETILNTP